MKTFIITAKEIDGQKLFDGEIKIRSDKDLTDPQLRELLAIRLSIELDRLGHHMRSDDLARNDWYNVEESGDLREDEIIAELTGETVEHQDKSPELTTEEIEYMDTPDGDRGYRPRGGYRG